MSNSSVYFSAAMSSSSVFDLGNTRLTCFESVNLSVPSNALALCVGSREYRASRVLCWRVRICGCDCECAIDTTLAAGCAGLHAGSAGVAHEGPKRFEGAVGPKRLEGADGSKGVEGPKGFSGEGPEGFGGQGAAAVDSRKLRCTNFSNM